MSQPTIDPSERKGNATPSLVGAALIFVPARATPSNDVATTILAQSLFDELHVNAHTRIPELWKAKLRTSTSSTTSSRREGPPAGIRIPGPA